MDRRSDLATRITLAFTLLAVLVALSAWLAWRSNAQAQVAQSSWQRVVDWEDQLRQVERAATLPAGRALCAAGGMAPSGASAGALTEREPWVEPLQRALQQAATFGDETPPRLTALLKHSVELWSDQLVKPVAQACAQDAKWGWVEVQSRMRQALPAQARMDEALREALKVAQARRADAAGQWLESSQSMRRWLGWLALLSVLTGAGALIASRGFMQQLLDVRRRVFDEGREREHAKEELAVTQRRMRVLVDHVKDAVIAFDAHGDIQWINPAGEAMFGAERSDLMGASVTTLMPQLEAELQAAALVERATVTDELGLPWFSKTVAIEGLRLVKVAGVAERIALDVSLVQTRVGGHVVGVAVARDLSHVRRLQREKETVLATLQREVVPELKTLQAQLHQLMLDARTWDSTPADEAFSDEEAAARRALLAQGHQTAVEQAYHRAQTLGRLVDEALTRR